MNILTLEDLYSKHNGFHYSFIDFSRSYIVGMFIRGISDNSFSKQHDSEEFQQYSFISPEALGYVNRAVYCNSSVSDLTSNLKLPAPMFATNIDKVLVVSWTQYEYDCLYDYFHRNPVEGRFYFQISFAKLKEILGEGALEKITNDLRVFNDADQANNVSSTIDTLNAKVTELTEQLKQKDELLIQALPFVRTTGWIAYAWNDHNCQYQPHHYARELCKDKQLETIDKFNEFLDKFPEVILPLAEEKKNG